MSLEEVIIEDPSINLDTDIKNTKGDKYQSGEPIDHDGYYKQQNIRGQPVYVQGPPPPPEQANRMAMFRSGEQTRQDREERGQEGTGNFWNLWGNRRDSNDSQDSNRQFLFDTVEIRNQFVRKVYTLLTIQLFITFGFIFTAIHVKPIRLFLLSNLTLLIVVMVLTFVFIIILTCCTSVARNFPCNIICFIIVTLLYTYLLATISCIYDVKVVYIATGSTALVCLLVSILACQMKYDLTQCACILYILLIGLMIYGVLCVILAYFVEPETFKIMHFIYGALGLALFIVYLMFDTQLIMGGRSIEISPEDYILGALKLYIDIVLIFQYMLMLIQCMRG